jgi:hypothetical protein
MQRKKSHTRKGSKRRITSHAWNRGDVAWGTCKVRVKKARAGGMRHLSGESSGMYTFRGGRQPTQDYIHCHDNIMYVRLSGFETLFAHEKNVCIIERE